jgi:molybdate transport system regulatory protein
MPCSKVWLELGGQIVLSEWRVELLEAIDETGSLSKAARQRGVPYRTAWYKLREIEDRLGVKLLTTQSGGERGGSSRLTPEARELVIRFRRLSAGVAELVEQQFCAEFGDVLG